MRSSSLIKFQFSKLMEPDSKLILDPHTRSDLFYQLREVRAQLHQVVAHSSPAPRKTDDINTCPTYELRTKSGWSAGAIPVVQT